MTLPARDIFLHLYNHGVHHRSQVSNMLRQLGVERPWMGLDYIFMKLQQPESPPLSLKVIRDYFEFSDWAQNRIHDRAEKLSDAQIDQRFDMGVSTLRDTLMHIRDAEDWWFRNWTIGPEHVFPKREQRQSLAAVRDDARSIAEQRNQYLNRLSDQELMQTTRCQPVPGKYRQFVLGQSMIQLCCHGTHHRAQVLNMLRHLGAEPSRMDFLVMKREQSHPYHGRPGRA